MRTQAVFPSLRRVCAGTMLLIGTGCSTAPAPAPPSPRTASEAPSETAVASLLAPSEAALRTAADAELVGTELGTMWTFENPPLEHWENAYGFTPDPAWLDHVRLSSVRYGQHCSASFVSPSGLVMTNWHCAQDCAEDVSTEQQDYVERGFYAPTRAEEKVCPGLYLDQLIEIEDVTQRVRGAAPAGTGAVAATRAEEAAQEEIQAECEAQTDYSCQVVSLYHGGQYQLYKYRRFQPVKLVFVPEKQAGFYGGDPDNFTYPRYNLDVAFVRAYQSGGAQPAATAEHYFRWDADGASEGELVFVTGNPGSTSRLITVSQLLYEQQYAHPLNVAILSAQADYLRSVAAMGPEAERQVREQLFSVENSLKAFTGQLGGLLDTLLVGRKIAWEREFRERVAAEEQLRQRFGGVWDSMAVVQARKRAVSPPLNLGNPEFLGLPPFVVAGGIVELVHARSLPEAQRPEDLRGQDLSALAQQLQAANVPPPESYMPLVELRFSLLRFLPDDHPLVREALRPGESPAAAARRVVAGSRIGDPAFRQRILSLDPASLDTVSDPLISLVEVMHEVGAGLDVEWEELQAAQAELEERLADALFAVYGTAIPPDATFTLRISDGVVARYPYNGTFAPPHTTYYGLWNRARGFNGDMPWALPSSFRDKSDVLDMSTPLNFVTTNDITGGNSGSPMIDREARVVGLAFDGNIEQLPNEFLFRPEAGRTVGVHAAGIIEALRKIYGAEALVAEIVQ